MTAGREFNPKIGKILGRFDHGPSEILSSRLEERTAGAKTDEKQKKGEAAPEYSVEQELQISALAAIIQASMDMHDLSLFWGDSSRTFSQDHLEYSKVSIALINRARSDIQLGHHEGGDRLRTRAFCWKQTALTNTIIENRAVDEEYKYRPDRWTKDLLNSIRLAVEAEANIICLGEFDYPPKFFPEYPEKKFRRDLNAIINSSKEPVILFAGTQHERYASHDGEREFHAHNVGHVFLNKVMLSTQGHVEGDGLKIYKRTPASKVGEQLSRRFGNVMQGYRTLLGRISFLICADAYDPTIVFEFFAKSANATNKPEITFVPAYNISPKLAEMCKVLSLMMNGIVVLVDVCAETSSAGKGKAKPFTRIWNSGFPATAKSGIRLERTVDLDSGGAIQFWSLDWRKARQFQSRSPVEKLLPLFHEARKKVDSRRDRNRG